MPPRGLGSTAQWVAGASWQADANLKCREKIPVVQKENNLSASASSTAQELRANMAGTTVRVPWATTQDLSSEQDLGATAQKLGHTAPQQDSKGYQLAAGKGSGLAPETAATYANDANELRIPKQWQQSRGDSIKTRSELLELRRSVPFSFDLDGDGVVRCGSRTGRRDSAATWPTCATHGSLRITGRPEGHIFCVSI